MYNTRHLTAELLRPACLMSICLLTILAVGCRSPQQEAAAPTVNPPATSSSTGPTTQPTAGWITPPGRVVLRVRAKGVQIYRAETGLDGQMKWTLVGPEAELRDAAGQVVGKHYKGDAGPMWEHADGSKVVGKKRPGGERKSPHPDSVPELQLDAKAAPGGPAGVLSKVSFIERLDTTGGQPPAATPSTAIGEEARSPYTAEYVFYAPRE